MFSVPEYSRSCATSRPSPSPRMKLLRRALSSLSRRPIRPLRFCLALEPFRTLRAHNIRRGVRKLGLFGTSCHTVGGSRLTRRGTTHSRDLSGRGAARAEVDRGKPTQSHISPSILVYEENRLGLMAHGVLRRRVSYTPPIYAPLPYVRGLLAWVAD